MENIKGIIVKELSYDETSVGVASEGNVYMDGEKVGVIKYDGRGGATFLDITDKSKKEEFYGRMTQYFSEIGFNANNIDDHSLKSTFATHLLALEEDGEIDDETLKLGFVS